MFFPLMKIQQLTGWVDVVNFPPNNWEYRKKSSFYLYLLHSNDSEWIPTYLDEIKFGQELTLNTEEFRDIFTKTSLGLIYPSYKKLDLPLPKLPGTNNWKTELPAWRASSGFKNTYSQVSFQSDLSPLPLNGTLLTFHPFIQFGEMQNYLIVLNAELNPKKSKHNLYVFNSKNAELIDKLEIQTNSTNLINLDIYDFAPTDLPVFACKTMAAIPFGFGISSNFKNMSLEHTHPPGSFVVRGDRNKIQKQIKSRWFHSLGLD